MVLENFKSYLISKKIKVHSRISKKKLSWKKEMGGIAFESDAKKKNDDTKRQMKYFPKDEKVLCYIMILCLQGIKTGIQIVSVRLLFILAFFRSRPL